MAVCSIPSLSSLNILNYFSEGLYQKRHIAGCYWFSTQNYHIHVVEFTFLSHCDLHSLVLFIMHCVGPWLQEIFTCRPYCNSHALWGVLIFGCENRFLRYYIDHPSATLYDLVSWDCLKSFLNVLSVKHC